MTYHYFFDTTKHILLHGPYIEPVPRRTQQTPPQKMKKDNRENTISIGGLLSPSGNPKPVALAISSTISCFSSAKKRFGTSPVLRMLLMSYQTLIRGGGSTVSVVERTADSQTRRERGRPSVGAIKVWTSNALEPVPAID